jgi:hypothetical protein
MYTGGTDVTTKRPELQGTWFPFDYVMAVLDNADDAEKAVKDLRDAGFHAEDIQLLHGEEAAARLDVDCQHCNLVKHLTRWLWSFATVEGLILSEYAKEGRAGHHVLGVHIYQSEEVRRAAEILKAHHAHRIERFGHTGGLTEVTA